MVRTTLRRRGQVVVPLDALEAEEEEEKAMGSFGDPSSQSSANSNVFDHYASPCEFRVSNDPLLLSDKDVCDATIYGCVRDHSFLQRPDDNVRELQVRFDYDMYYKFDSRVHDFQDMLEFLEGTMLEHLASLLDLKQCPPEEFVSTETSLQREPDNEEDNNNNRRRLEEFTDEQKAAIIAINSDPVDLKSTSYGCMQAPPGGTGVECQSMEGTMTLYIEEARVALEEQEFQEKAAEIQESVFRAIQTGMETDVYVKAVIEKVVYIDARNTTTSAPVATPAVVEVEEQPTEIDAAGLDGTQIGLIAGASTLVFIIFLLVCCFLARRRRVESESDNDEPDLPKEPLPEDEANGRCNMIVGGGNRRNSQVAPSYSLEGAERPGSLAARDALALRPQRSGEGVEMSVEVGDDDGNNVRMPPAISRMVKSSSSSLGSLGTRSPQGSLASPMESLEDLKARLAYAYPTAPLSPVSNPRRGISPSKVSPKRQFKHPPLVSRMDSGGDNDKEDAYSSSAIEVQPRVGSGGGGARGGGGGGSLVDSAIRTFRKIVSSESEINNISRKCKPVACFDVDDTSSFDSRSRRSGWR